MISKEEAIQKYGDVPLLFQSYYKYSFTFKGVARDGVKIIVGMGGSSDDIYRENVERDTPVFLKNDEFRSITIKCTAADGKEDIIFEEVDWF